MTVTKSEQILHLLVLYRYLESNLQGNVFMNKTIKSIKAEYASRISELRAERDRAIQEVREARQEKREQQLDQPLLGIETPSQQAERIYHEVAELATRFTELTETGSNAFYQRLNESHNLPADTYHGGEGLSYIGFTKDEAVACEWLQKIMDNNYTHQIIGWEHDEDLSIEFPSESYGCAEIYGWETEKLEHYINTFMEE